MGPMRAVQYKTASGASIDVRVAGGAFVGMFKSIAARWTLQEQIGGMAAMLNENSVLRIGNDSAVIVQIEGGSLADRATAVRQIAAIVAERLQHAAPVATRAPTG